MDLVFQQNPMVLFGLGNTTNFSSPKQVGAGWLKITAAYGSVLSIKSTGAAWTWGRNDHGQLGLGNTTNYSSPKQVGSLTTWLSTAAGGYQTIALLY